VVLDPVRLVDDDQVGAPRGEALAMALAACQPVQDLGRPLAEPVHRAQRDKQVAARRLSPDQDAEVKPVPVDVLGQDAQGRLGQPQRFGGVTGAERAGGLVEALARTAVLGAAILGLAPGMGELAAALFPLLALVLEVEPAQGRFSRRPDAGGDAILSQEIAGRRGARSPPEGDGEAPARSWWHGIRPERLRNSRTLWRKMSSAA
jgi:hypothetical protein